MVAMVATATASVGQWCSIVGGRFSCALALLLLLLLVVVVVVLVVLLLVVVALVLVQISGALCDWIAKPSYQLTTNTTDHN